MAVTLKANNLAHIQEIFEMGLGARPTIRLILTIQGKAAAYALVWEWGRITCKPGPKTLWSTNPDGERAVLTKTAPHGFIRVNRAQYRQIVHDDIQKRLRWKGLKIKDIPKAIMYAFERAAPKVAHLIAETAPYDTGALYDAIEAAIAKFSSEPVTVDMLSVRTRAHLE